MASRRLVLAAALSAAIYAQGVVPILPIPPAKDPIGRAFGWRELTVAADSTASAESARSHTTTWLAGDRYQEASVMAFYDPSHPATFSLNLAGRPNQFDLWPSFGDTAQNGDNLVVALDDSDQLHAEFQSIVPLFAEVRRGALVTLRRGSGVVGTRRLWVFVNWNGQWSGAGHRAD